MKHHYPIFVAKVMKFSVRSCCSAFICLMPILGVGQSGITVTGTVTSADGVGGGMALSGVSVMVKGSDRGTTTNESGQFSIEVPSSDAILVFTYLGYQSQEVQVGNNRMLDVSLSVS